MSVKKVMGKLWDEAKPSFDHGRSELVAGLMTGNAFVMYPRAEPGAELPMAAEIAEMPAADKAMSMDDLRALAREYHPAPEMGRDGMEM